MLITLIIAINRHKAAEAIYQIKRAKNGFAPLIALIVFTRLVLDRPGIAAGAYAT
jgi:hypothetical protein